MLFYTARHVTLGRSALVAQLFRRRSISDLDRQEAGKTRCPVTHFIKSSSIKFQSIKFIISVAHCRLDFTKKTVEKIQAQC